MKHPPKRDPKRKKPPTKSEKLAAALLHLDTLRCKVDPTLAACIERSRAKLMTPKQIEQHFEWDHDPVPRALDGTNHPTNLNPRPVANHREKTHKKDIPMLAKVRRSLKSEKFVVKRPQEPEAKSEIGVEIAVESEVKPEVKAETRPKIKSRPMAGTKASGWKIPMSGKAHRR